MIVYDPPPPPETTSKHTEFLLRCETRNCPFIVTDPDVTYCCEGCHRHGVHGPTCRGVYQRRFSKDRCHNWSEVWWSKEAWESFHSNHRASTASTYQPVLPRVGTSRSYVPGRILHIAITDAMSLVYIHGYRRDIVCRWEFLVSQAWRLEQNRRKIEALLDSYA